MKRGRGDRKNSGVQNGLEESDMKGVGVKNNGEKM